MAFYKERDGKVEILFPVSDVDAVNGSEMKDYISKIADEVSAVIINFSRVTYLNSSGLRELIQILKLLQDKGKKLYITFISDSIKKIFANTNLIKIFSIYPTDEDAKRSL
ncbi:MULTISPECIES: STAS domain-containing protein [Calditerrivibrio]|jgi:anti-sigma B factor antagonist|uniref:STAS domain-containing protein n=1 Tax=Calditerrivibrio TaxID=545865 RepID=UPI003C709676